MGFFGPRAVSFPGSPLYQRRCRHSDQRRDPAHSAAAEESNLNAYAERFVRSIKEECLARVVPLGEGHLRLLAREYVEHYHRERIIRDSTTGLCSTQHPCDAR